MSLTLQYGRMRQPMENLRKITSKSKQKWSAQETRKKRCTSWSMKAVFWGPCPLTEFCQVQNSLCVQVLRSPILAALLHDTRAPAASQTLWHGTRNGITELLQRSPPIFSWAAIALGIVPHSSFVL